MWRILSLLIVPISMMAQTPSLSLLRVEPGAEGHVLQLRNLYSSAITCYVIGYEPSGFEQRRRNQWDLLLQTNSTAAPLEAGATRVFPADRASAQAEAWKPLAVIYADGTYAGDSTIIQSILDNRRAAAEQIQRVLEILNAGGDVEAGVERSFQETRIAPGRGSRTLSAALVQGYVRRELKRGITPGEIVKELKSWQVRLQQYELAVAFI